MLRASAGLDHHADLARCCAKPTTAAGPSRVPRRRGVGLRHSGATSLLGALGFWTWRGRRKS